MQQLDNFLDKCAVKRTDGLLEHAAQGTMWQPQALTPQQSRKVLSAIRMVIMLALMIIGPAPRLAPWMSNIHWWDLSQRHFFPSPPPPYSVIPFLTHPTWTHICKFHMNVQC